VDMRSPQPAYLQLAAQLRRGITAMGRDEQIPSTHALVAQTGLAIGTVRKTVRLLMDEGLVYSVPGRGVFVR
jgi:DNA-binding GntR family transcriptional regulator